MRDPVAMEAGFPAPYHVAMTVSNLPDPARVALPSFEGDYVAPPLPLLASWACMPALLSEGIIPQAPVSYTHLTLPTIYSV